MSISSIQDISDFINKLIDEEEINNTKRPKHIFLKNEKIEIPDNIYCIDFSDFAGKIGEKFIEQSLNSEYFTQAVQCAREILISKGYTPLEGGVFYLKRM